MERYSLKKDIKQISYTSTIIFTVLILFSIFALAVIFPIYYYSKTFPRLYSLFSALIFLTAIIFFLARWFMKIWNKYKKIKPLMLHLMLSPLIICVILVLLGMEFIILRLVEFYTKINTDNSNLFATLQMTVFIVTGLFIIYNLYFTAVSVFLIIEICAFRILFEIFPVLYAALIFGLLTILLIAGLMALRILIHNIKIYLKNGKFIGD